MNKKYLENILHVNIEDKSEQNYFPNKTESFKKLPDFVKSIIDKIQNFLKEISLNDNLIDILLEGKQINNEIIEEVASRGSVYTRIKVLIGKLRNFLEGNTGILKTIQTALPEEKKGRITKRSGYIC